MFWTLVIGKIHSHFDSLRDEFETQPPVAGSSVRFPTGFLSFYTLKTAQNQMEPLDNRWWGFEVAPIENHPIDQQKQTSFV